MPQDYEKFRGPTKRSRPEAGGANTRTVPVFGIVKDNIDPNRSGRLKVYISDFGGLNPDDSSNWVSVGYMSSFFGRLTGDAGSDPSDFGKYIQNPSSYGEWHAPPDIGTVVICVFVNGDMNYGFYIGAVPEPQTLQMVPAIGAEETVVPNESEASSYGGATVLPVTNMNTNNFSAAYSSDFIKTPKPIHSYAAAIMAQQGIIRDPIRGPITSSAQREPASRVGWGVSSPGRPIYEGGYDDQTIESNLSANPERLRVVARRGGHSIVLDDGDALGNDDLVRIRTARGHQILMSDNGQTLMILHSNGQSYIELGKEGTVDVYSTNSINLRTQGDLNLHADNNVNIHAKKDMNFYAENMNFTTEKEMNQRVGSDYKGFTAGTHTEKVGGAMAFQSSGEASFDSSGTTYINGGSKINLNSGKASTKPEEVEAITIIPHTDTLFNQETGFTAAPGALHSITSRAPAHAPWSNAGQGVDVQTDLSASSQLPTPPSLALGNATAAGISTGVNPVAAATAASVPSLSAVSQNLDVNTTGAVLGSIAQNTQNGPFRVAQQQGAAIVESSTGQSVVGVGAFGQTPEKLEKAGVLKLGSHRLIDALAQSGANVSQCMPDALFSGQSGAENLTNLTRNVTAQANVEVINLQKTQTELTNAGVLTGKEAAGEVAGVVLAGSTTGVKNTIDAIKNTSSGESSGASVPNETIKQIGFGAAAARVASVVTGVFGGLTQSLAAMTGLSSQRSGVEASAFSSISQGFAKLKANVPQNLKTINNASAEKTQLLSNQNSQTNTNVVSTIAGGALGAVLGNQVGGGSGRAVATAAGAVAGSLIGSNLTRKPRKSAVPSEASGVSNLPGGEKVLSMVKEGTDTAKNALPGTAQLKDVIDSQTTDKVNNIRSSSTGQFNSTRDAVTANLSVAEKAQLASGLSSIATQGKKKIKLPTVSTNTVDRSKITSSTKSLLGDSRIPEPDFTGEPNRRTSVNTSAASTARTSQNNARIEQLRAEISALDAEIVTVTQQSQEAFNLRQNSLPGDSEWKQKFNESETRRRILITERRDKDQNLSMLIANRDRG